MELPFKLTHSFDQNLREVPDEPDQFDKAIDHLLDQLKANNQGLALAIIHSKLGSLLRVRGRHDESLSHHLKAEELLGLLNEPRLRMINNIRSASAFQFLGSFSRAKGILEKCILEIGEDKALCDLLDFAHQHLGKIYFDLGDFSKAKLHLETALNIRLHKKDEHLIRSSQFALDVVRSKA